jgi:hypothetical protein
MCGKDDFLHTLTRLRHGGEKTFPKKIKNRCRTNVCVALDKESVFMMDLAALIQTELKPSGMILCLSSQV